MYGRVPFVPATSEGRAFSALMSEPYQRKAVVISPILYGELRSGGFGAMVLEMPAWTAEPESLVTAIWMFPATTIVSRATT